MVHYKHLAASVGLPIMATFWSI